MLGIEGNLNCCIEFIISKSGNYQHDNWVWNIFLPHIIFNDVHCYVQSPKVHAEVRKTRWEPWNWDLKYGTTVGFLRTTWNPAWSWTWQVILNMTSNYEHYTCGYCGRNTYTSTELSIVFLARKKYSRDILVGPLATQKHEN
jgi:hypothetical protein